MNLFLRPDAGHGIRPIVLWSLRDDVLVESAPGDDDLVLLSRWGEVRVDRPGPAVRESLRRMSFGPVSLGNVIDDAAAEERHTLATLLDALQNVLVRSIGLADAGGPLMSVVPITSRARFAPVPVPGNRVVRLSRAASLRTHSDSLVLESPLSDHRVVLHDPLIAAAVAALAAPATVTAAGTALGWSDELFAEVVGYLVAAGMVRTAEPGPVPRFAEDSDPVLRPWTHHELTFHIGIRGGRADAGPPDECCPPDPSDGRSARPVSRPLPLPRPPGSMADDPPLTAALAAQRSYQDFAGTHVTVAELGALLYRAARGRFLREEGELEVYVVAAACSGVPRAIHWYDPDAHALVGVNDREEDVTALLREARIAGGMAHEPPVLVTITSRLGRLRTGRAGEAYATTLRHVGALQEVLCLVATAMGLAPCAVTVLDEEDASSHALGLDWRAEFTAGGFAVGHRPGSAGS
ncbi:SagB family peptide dehydrogenase [Dactylosporangium sp. NPDC051484]|uniref:SagB family peptide dehydrogenase n=1 Tax=Dactylosporangium sp. NPDC051484 TaxID=3154942 RepID=UPI00344BE1F3